MATGVSIVDEIGVPDTVKTELPSAYVANAAQSKFKLISVGPAFLAEIAAAGIMGVSAAVATVVAPFHSANSD